MNKATRQNSRIGGRMVMSGLLAIALATTRVYAQAVPATPISPRPAATENTTQTTPAERPADAPPLVPLTKDRDGNFRIAPPFVADLAFTEKEGVPKGKVVRFTISSADSKVFPTTAGRGGDATPFERPVAVYTPAGYVPGTPAPFIVVQDGHNWYARAEAPGQTNSPQLSTMLDNLIQEKRVPPMLAIMIDPTPNPQRSFEYDTVFDKYTMFIENEVLPKITKDYNIAFTKDPEGRATFGESSGAAAALTMAWLHPELYRRVISVSGTFVNLQRDPDARMQAPHGAWEYHENFIPKNDPKPIRIWLEVGENDNGANAPESGMRNWVIANNHMADVLKAKGYHYQFVFAETARHVARPVQLQTLPEAFEWVWQGYQPK